MSTPSSPPKLTLFCPECSHQSHVDRWHPTDVDGPRLRCPACRAVVGSRQEPPPA